MAARTTMKKTSPTKKSAAAKVRWKKLDKILDNIPAVSHETHQHQQMGRAIPEMGSLTSILDLVKREIGHKDFRQRTLKLGSFCTEDVSRSKDGAAHLDALVKKANFLVGRKIIRATVDPVADFNPFAVAFDINLHFD
jgi:hypothetical protein